MSTVVALAACGGRGEAAVDVVDGACFEVHQAKLASNGLSMQGISLNGIQVNALTANGQDLNGDDLNGSALGFGVRLDGGRLVAERDGARLPDDALVGFTFNAGEGRGAVTFRVTSVTLDETDERLAFYALAIEGGGAVCEDGNERGVFVAGSFDASGAYVPDASGQTVSYACANGVMNKCVHWGYKPWTTSADAYQTCTRMARADYCGDGVPWTQNGTLIDVYDGFGVQERAGVMEFEAGWSVDGATCVAAPRYEIYDAAGAAVRPSCWDALPSCASLAEAEALGALIANDSAHEPIVACAR